MNSKISLEYEVKLNKAIEAMKTASSMVKIMSNEVRATQTSFKSASNQIGMFSSYNKQLKTNLENISKSLKTYRTALTKIENAEVKGATNKQLQVNAVTKYKEAISILLKEQAKQQSQLAINQKLEEEYKTAGVKNSQELIEQKQKEKKIEQEVRAEEKKKVAEQKQAEREIRAEQKKKIEEQKQAEKERKELAKDAIELEKQEKEKIKEVKERVIELGEAIKNTISGFCSGLASPFKTVISGINKIENSVKGSISKIEKLSSTIKTKFIDKAIDYSEELNLFNVVFENIEKDGETTFSELGKKATQFQNQLNEALGTNKMESMRYQGLYQSMTLSAGIGKEASYLMSESMTKLGYDLASLFNTTEKQAMEALRGGVLAGQTKPLRGYGIDVTQQTYKPILADLGIDKRVSELSQAEKEILRYIATIRQATAAQGDFADTIESPANQLKVLKNQLLELSVSIGNYFITPFQKALQVINGVIMTLKALVNFIGKLMGIQEKQFNSGFSYSGEYEDEADDLGSVGDNASSATKKVKELQRQVLGFDQINNITTPTDSSSSGSSGVSGNYGIDERLLGELEGYESFMEKVKMRAVEIRDTIMEWLGFTKQINEETKEISFTYDTTGKSLKDIAGEIGTNAGKGLNELIDNINWEDYGKKLANGLNVTFAFINNFVQSYNWKNLGIKIATFINTAISDTDFNELGKTLTNKIRIAILGISGFLETFNFKEFGSNLAKTINSAISNIPLDELVSGINSLANGIFDATVELFKGLDWNQLISDIFNVIKGLNWKSHLMIVLPAIFGALKGLLGSSLIKNIVSEGIGSLITSKVLGKKSKIDTGDVGKLISSGSGKMKLDINKFGSSSLMEKLADIDLATATKAVGKLSALIVIVGGVVTAFGELTRIPGLKKYLSEGIDILSKLFLGLTKIAIPAAALAVGMNLLGKIPGGIKSTAVGLADLAIAIGGMSAIVGVIGGIVSWAGIEVFDTGIETIVKIFTGIGEILVPLIATTALMLGLGALNLAGLGAIAIGFVAIEEVILALIAVIKTVSLLSQTEGFDFMINRGQEVLIKIAETLGGFVGALAGSFVSNFSEQVMKSLDSLGTHLSALWSNGKDFFEGVKTIDENTTQGIKNLASSILLITAQQILDGIFAFVTGGSSLDKFGRQLPKFGENLKKYYDKVKGIKGDVITATSNSAKALAELESLVPRQAGLAQLFAGSKSLLLFGAQLPIFGACLKSYADKISGIDGSVVTDSATAAKSLAELESNIPNKAGLWQLCAGTKSLLLFGAELPLFGTYLKQYADNIAGINGDVVTSSANSAMALAELANSVPNSQSLFSAIFTGDKSLANFGAQVEQFGKSLGQYSKSVSGFDVTKARESNSVVKTILDMLERANSIGISETVKNLKSGVKTYTNTIQDFIKNAFSGDKVSTNKGAGYKMGQNIGTNIKNGIKNTLSGISLKVTDSSGKKISNFSVKAYANGGFPKSGQLFWANEAGPEMVGRIGNKTAVANNNQIVSAIKTGVYDAVSNAMSSANGGTVKIEMHTDEGVIVDRINKITRQTGTCPINI